MSYFTHNQDQVLRELLQDILKEPNSTHAKMITENNLIESLSKSAWMEIIKQDVQAVAENEGNELTEKQLIDVSYLVADYDYAEYNEYISYSIGKIVDKEEE